MLLLTLTYRDEILCVFICLRLVLSIYNNKNSRNNNGNDAANHNSDDVVDNDVDDNDNDNDVQWKKRAH